MKSTLRILVLAVLLLALMAPLTSFAQEPCPDDPELSATCVQDAPPFYVVVNRDFEDLTRLGTGCQPIILNHPDCTGCDVQSTACDDVETQMTDEVCPMLADEVDWTTATVTATVYEMWCACATAGCDAWQYTVRVLDSAGNCPVDPDQVCVEGLPPGTGIDLPAPVIVGGLAVIGVGLLGVGLVLRRRSVRLA
jgi:hypothetical protein